MEEGREVVGRASGPCSLKLLALQFRPAAASRGRRARAATRCARGAAALPAARAPPPAPTPRPPPRGAWCAPALASPRTRSAPADRAAFIMGKKAGPSKRKWGPEVRWRTRAHARARANISTPRAHDCARPRRAFLRPHAAARADAAARAPAPPDPAGGRAPARARQAAQPGDGRVEGDLRGLCGPQHEAGVTADARAREGGARGRAGAPLTRAPRAPHPRSAASASCTT